MKDEDASDFPSKSVTQRGPRRHLFALRGALTFLTRIPLPGRTPADWRAFRSAPWTFPLVGGLIGAIAGTAFFVNSPWTAAGVYLVLIYVVGGITHADGLADLGDAIAVHDPDRRRSVLADPALGVGGAVALVVTLLVTAFGAVGVSSTIAASPTGSVWAAFAIVLAAEVGTKAGMALLVCLGSPAHDGLGSELITASGGRACIPVAIISALVLLAAPPGSLLAVLTALLVGPIIAIFVLRRAPGWIGGISGDVLGATNELGRAVALHAGVIVWAIG